MRSLKDSAKKGRVSISSFNGLTKQDNYTDVTDEDTFFKSFERIAGNTYALNFRIKEISKDSFIYRVAAFPHWENLQENTTLRVYNGPEFIIYNETSNCLKGIPHPKARFVEDQCLSLNGLDPKLQNWPLAMEPNFDEPIIVKTITHSFIFCYDHTIEIDNQVRDCPYYTIRLPIDKSFKVRNHTHVADTEIASASLFGATSYVDAGTKHLKVQPALMSEAKMLEKLWNMQDRLTKCQYVLSSKPALISTQIYIACTL